MSAFYVGPDHLTYLVRCFATVINPNRDSLYTTEKPLACPMVRTIMGYRGTTYAINPRNTDEAAALYGRLSRENWDSLQARYPDSGSECPEALPSVWLHRTFTQRLPLLTVPDIAAAMKALDCYEYQACEHDGWEKSDVKAWCHILRRGLLMRLPGFDAAYSAAPWGCPVVTPIDAAAVHLDAANRRDGAA